jgi:hypothetical protein
MSTHYFKAFCTFLWPINSVLSAQSAIKFPSCLGVFVAENQSIKNNKLCETKPISEMLKMVVRVVKTMTNNKKQRTINCQKQSQNKPKQSQFYPPPADLSGVALAKTEALAKVDSKGGQAGQANPCGQRFAD